MTDLAWQRDHAVPGGSAVDPQIFPHLAYGKGLMDQIRVEIDAMQDEERALLSDRIADINAIRVRDYMAEPAQWRPTTVPDIGETRCAERVGT